MTREEAINRLVDILSEANRTGDAVCYITSEDNETIKTAIKALKQQESGKKMTDYKRAFKITCELLNGTTLYGVDSEKIFEVMMNKDGIVDNESYEEYILSHIDDLDHGQYISQSESEVGE